MERELGWCRRSDLWGEDGEAGAKAGTRSCELSGAGEGRALRVLTEEHNVK
jgi:hypothetical protein